MRKILSSVIALLIAVPVVASAQVEVKVYVNGMRVNEKVILSNDRTYIPLRAVGEAMGADVEWDDSTKSAFITFTEDDAIAKIVSDVSPSVVTIVGNSTGKTEADKYNNLTAHGSGVIYKSNGYIVTNSHVVKDLKNLTVVLNDGTILPGKVLCSDDTADVAIVKVEKLGLKPVTMADKSSIVSGKTAIAIGTPISLTMRNTVTRGIVCGNGVVLNNSHYKLIQTDATVNPGNSGGPLLNTKGELIGINSSKYVSMSIDNVAFAIPVDTINYIINQYEKNGFVKRPTFKFELDECWEAKIGLPTKKGLTVKNSTDSDIINGDVITSVGGIEVHSIADWNEAIKSNFPKETINIEYSRNGVGMQVDIKG